MNSTTYICKTDFNGMIDDLFADLLVDGEYKPYEYRVGVVGELVEGYYDSNGEYPDSSQLSRLGSYIIKEDNRLSEALEREYAILSNSQYQRRISRELDWAYADFIDSDGVDHRNQTRMNRIQNELRRGDIR